MNMCCADVVSLMLSWFAFCVCVCFKHCHALLGPCSQNVQHLHSTVLIFIWILCQVSHTKFVTEILICVNVSFCLVLSVAVCYI